MAAARRALLVACFFVCPLVFFTNLTRNPYITQISLLNIALFLAMATYAVEWARAGAPPASWRPGTALDLPLAAWLAVCLLTWGVGWLGHAAFFRPSMLHEGERQGLFLLANTAVPFALAALAVRQDQDAAPPPLGAWAAFAVAWGLLWTPFSQMRQSGAAAADLWGHVWDGYGAFVWAAGIAGALWLCRRSRWQDFLHLALAVGFLSSVYALLQFFNMEIIWPNALNPYGGRSVSTFGNPNFMSSYDVLLLPAAVLGALTTKGWRRAAYAATAYALEMALLCSLTRSSWVGAAAGLALLVLLPEVREAVLARPRAAGLMLCAGLALALVWPQSSVSSGYTPSVLGRLQEVGSLLRHEPYSPWHQRRLIWTCAWLMGRENPLTGQGSGLFELFYPFYQGPLLDAIAFYRTMRTHANNAHNELLEVWAQTGLVGLGAYFWLWTTFFASAWKRLRAGALSPWAAAAAAGVAGMLVDNLLNVSMHFAVPAFAFWWLAGLAAGVPRPKVEGEPSRRAWAKPVLLAGAVILSALGWYWVKVWFREAHYFAGFKLIRQGAMAASTRELELSRDWGPPEVNALYELGNAYARSDRYADAEKAYGEALDANAGYDEIYYNVAAVQGGKLGKPAKALDYYRVSWLINPSSNELYNNLSAAYLQDPKRYGAQALELLRHAVSFYPENPNHWNNIGYLESLERRYDEAESAYTRALSLDPSMSIAERNLAALERQAGRPAPRILTDLASLRELDARLAKNDTSDATVSLARRLAQEFPDLARTRFYLGSLYLSRGRPEEAKTELERAVARDPNHAWSHANLAEAYIALGKTEDAVRELRATLALDGSNARAQARLKSLGLQR